jgi:predicted neuraminidase
MGNIQMTGKSQGGPMYRGEEPLETALLLIVLLNELAQHAVDFRLTTEDLPDPQNRVTVDRSGNLTLSYTKNNQYHNRSSMNYLPASARVTSAATTASGSATMLPAAKIAANVNPS